MKSVLSVFGLESLRISGIEIYARELSRQLGERGWRSVICFHNRVPELVRDYLALPNVTLDVIPNSWTLRFKPIVDLGSTLRRYRPSILHLHYCGFLSVYPWLARLYGVDKVFFTDHTSRPEGYAARKAPLWKRALACGMNYPLTGVVCVSEYSYRCNTTVGLLPRERFHRIYNGVEIAMERESEQKTGQFRRKYSIPEGRSLVVQLSWMIREKGIADLLEAARVVISQNPNTHVAMVGDGAQRPSFMQRAAELGIAEHITWTGNVLNPFSEGVHAAADVICQVSRWEEVFGFVIAEGMLYRKPILATRVGGIPELVEDGKTGFLVERGDTAAMADRLLTLLCNPGLRQRMGEAGRRLAEAKFDLRKNVAELLQFYQLQ